jgi:hypothetical protein
MSTTACVPQGAGHPKPNFHRLSSGPPASTAWLARGQGWEEKQTGVLMERGWCEMRLALLLAVIVLTLLLSVFGFAVAWLCGANLLGIRVRAIADRDPR